MPAGRLAGHPPPLPLAAWLVLSHSGHSCCDCILQARAQLLRIKARSARRHRDMGCCGDCPRVRLRMAASLLARAVWHEQWVRISTLRLQALEQGQPYPPLTLPYPEAQPHLAEGVPLDLPPSIDRCAACQKELEEVSWQA